MPPDEPGLAPVIQLPLSRRPTPEQEAHREELLHAHREARRLRRLKLKLALAGAVLVGVLGGGLALAVDSTDEDGGPLSGEDASGDSPFGSSSGEGDDLAGPAWFSTTGGGRRGR